MKFRTKENEEQPKQRSIPFFRHWWNMTHRWLLLVHWEEMTAIIQLIHHNNIYQLVMITVNDCDWCCFCSPN